MTTMLFVDDCVNNERYYITLSDIDNRKITDNWNSPDTLLVDLVNTKFFEGKTTWGELKPIHFKFLIMRNFIHMDRLKAKQRMDTNNPVVASLYFLIGGLLRSISEKADTTVEFMKIIRITPAHINFDFHASLKLELDTFTNDDDPMEETALKVVVDNTKNA
jgi:hypothetical protein